MTGSEVGIASEGTKKAPTRRSAPEDCGVF